MPEVLLADVRRGGEVVTIATWPTVAGVKDCVNVETCLYWNRFLPSPQGDDQVEVLHAVVKRLSELRARDNDAYVRASKSLGWD